MKDVYYWVLNTNRKYSPNGDDENNMLNNNKCAAYGDSKFVIEKLKERDGDVVFLYRKAVGIIAFGEADGKLNICDYYDPKEDEKYEDFEYNMKLNNFNKLKEPLKYSELNNFVGQSNYSWLQPTLVHIGTEIGKKIKNELQNRIDAFQ